MTFLSPIRYPIPCPIRYPNLEGLSDTPKKRATEQLQLQTTTQRHQQTNYKRNNKQHQQAPSACRSGDVIPEPDVTVTGLPAGANA